METLIAAYDGRDHTWWGLSDTDRQRFNAWASEQGCPLDGRRVYRTEIHGVDSPVLRVFEYDLDDQGRMQIDHATGDTAKRAPYDRPVSSMPPVEPAPA